MGVHKPTIVEDSERPVKVGKPGMHPPVSNVARGTSKKLTEAATKMYVKSDEAAGEEVDEKAIGDTQATLEMMVEREGQTEAKLMKKVMMGTHKGGHRKEKSAEAFERRQLAMEAEWMAEEDYPPLVQ